MKEIIVNAVTCSDKETEQVAADFAERICEEIKDGIKGNIFIAMYGDVGVGKTVFTRGFASVVCPGEFVCSPTYALVNEYVGKHKICHYDMYRITSEDDLESTAFYDYKNCIIIAEWCENIPYALPESYYRVEISKLDDGTKRSIVIERRFPKVMDL